MTWKIIGVLLLAILIALMEVPHMLKNKLKKELWVFLSLLLIGIGLGIARSVDLELPSPLDLITAIYKPMSNAIFQVLK